MGILALCLFVQVSVPGQVVDLVREAGSGGLDRVNYLTSAGEIGSIDSQGNLSVWLPAGAFGDTAVALAPTADGSALTVLLRSGDLWRLPQGGGPLTQVYSDLFLLQECTDLAVDTAGNHWIAGRTVSSGVRCVALVSANGAEWGYFQTSGQPLGLCADPLLPSLLRSDSNGGLFGLQAVDQAPLQTSLGSAPGGSPFNFDGDLVADANGNAFLASGNQVWRFDRLAGFASPLGPLAGTVRGVAISGDSQGGTLWIAQGENPSLVQSLQSVAAPGPALVSAFHQPPTRGEQRLLFGGLNAFDTLTEGLESLLIGGDDFGSNPSIRRVSIPSFSVAILANAGTGLEGRVEGLSLDPNGQLLALTSSGSVQRIDRQTGQATTVFFDPFDSIVRGKDLALGRFGEQYVAVYSAFDQGFVGQALPSGALNLAPAQECRGLGADPIGARLLFSEWRDSGFSGQVNGLSLPAGSSTPLPGFAAVNYSNGPNWGDGDVLCDAEGRIYTTAEDEFCVKRYDPSTGLVARIASGYLNRPAGLTIARSTPAAASSTGFSLYVVEWNRIWELPNSPPPAPAWVDPGAPGVGRPRAQFSAQRVPLSLCAEPQTGLPLVLCIDGTLWRVPLAGAGAPQLVTTLVPTPIAISGAPNGWIFIAERNGRVRAVLPNMGYLVVDWYLDPQDQLSDVCDLALGGDGGLYLLEHRPTSQEGGRLWRLRNDQLTLIGDHSRGRRLRMSPTDGLALIQETGHSGEGGDLLAVDWLATPAMAGHLKLPNYERFDNQALDGGNPGTPAPTTPIPSGGLAFNLAGDAFVAEANTGRIQRVEAGTNARSLVAGHFARPQDIDLMAGSPGLAGPQGASLFVLDGFSLYEVGVPGLAPAALQAPTAPASSALLSRVEMAAAARRQLAAPSALSLRLPSEANKLYVCLASTTGKEPGLQLALLGNPSDNRSLPQNFDPLLWNLLTPPVFLAFGGLLDAGGNGQPAVVLPNSPGVQGLGRFLDLVTLVFDPLAINGISAVSNTAQLYLGP
jgi:hypothetical protein